MSEYMFASMCGMCFVLQSYHYIGRLAISKLLGNVGICDILWEFVGLPQEQEFEKPSVQAFVCLFCVNPVIGLLSIQDISGLTLFGEIW